MIDITLEDIDCTRVMELLYSNKAEDESLAKVACLITQHEIGINDFINHLFDTVELSYKQKFLVKTKMIKVSDISINIILENIRNKNDENISLELNLEIDEKLYK